MYFLPDYLKTYLHADIKATIIILIPTNRFYLWNTQNKSCFHIQTSSFFNECNLIIFTSSHHS